MSITAHSIAVHQTTAIYPRKAAKQREKRKQGKKNKLEGDFKELGEEKRDWDANTREKKRG